LKNTVSLSVLTCDKNPVYICAQLQLCLPVEKCMLIQSTQQTNENFKGEGDVRAKDKN